MTLRLSPWALLARLCACLVLPALGCADDDAGAGNGSEGGDDDGDGDRDGDDDAGIDAGFDAGAEDPLYAIAVWTSDPNGAWVGNLLVVEDLSAESSIDLADSIPFADDMAYATPGNGQVFVGVGGQPLVERYTLNADGMLERDARMGLDQYGIGSGLGTKDPLHFISETKAYFIDEDSLQVVIFDPTKMETEDVFSIEGFEHETYPWLGLNYVHRDGDRLLLSARYWREDDTAAPLTRVAIIDTTDDSVTYVDDTRCGNIAFHARDSENNLYLASHTFQTGAIAVGAAGDPVAQSCIIRFKAGAGAFDESYYVNLDELAGGSAGCVMQGPGDEAFVLVYAGDPYTLDNFEAAPKETTWEVYSVTLGDEEATFEKAEGIGQQSGYGLAFATVVEGMQVPYVISVKDDFSEGAYWNAADASRLQMGMKVPGWPGNALKLR